MPRERQEFFRESKTSEKERIVVLAFEGNDTERLYFEALRVYDRFNDDLIYLHLLTRKKTDTNSSPSHVFKKLKKEAKDEYNFGSSDELWMIIDKDRWKNIPEVISLCAEQGNMFVAGSNPCFEMWLLLHVKDISSLSKDEKDKLLANKRVSGSKNSKKYIDKFLSDLLDAGYNKSNPKPERFLELIDTAIKQGEDLDNPPEDFPSDLGSHVYKIVKQLID